MARPISPPQRKKIHALIREHHVTDRPAFVLGDFIHNAIGRRVESLNDLNVHEASIVIEMLEKDAADRATDEPALFAEEPQS